MKNKPVLENRMLRAISAGMWLFAATQPGFADMYKLVDLGVYNGEAAGINNSGQIVGWTYDTYWAEDFAVFWTNSSSAPFELAAVPDYYSEAFSINASGQIAGGEQLGQNQGYAYEGAYWSSSTNTAHALFSYIWGGAYGINDSGQIVGFADTAENKSHAAYWNNYNSFSFVDLGTLGGTASQAQSINSAGQIAGFADTAAGYPMPPFGPTVAAQYWT